MLVCSLNAVRQAPNLTLSYERGWAHLIHVHASARFLRKVFLFSQKAVFPPFFFGGHTDLDLKVHIPETQHAATESLDKLLGFLSLNFLNCK